MNQLATDSPSSTTAIERIAALSKERGVWVRVGRMFDGASHSLVREAD